MRSREWSRAKRWVVTSPNAVKKLKRLRAKKDRSETRSSLANGGDGWSTAARKNGSRDIA